MRQVNESTGSAAAGVRHSFMYVTTLFFAWGFITATIDPLIPAVKSIFSLSYTEAFLSQFAFFMAYFVVSLPAAMMVERLGAARAILAALTIMIGGCLLFPLAVAVDTFKLVLLALFVLGSGITLLQVAANPLAAALGSPDRSHFRLTLSQAFNSLGTVLGPLIIGRLILEGGVFAESGGTSLDSRTESLHTIEASFMGVALAILLLAAFLWRVRHRIAEAVPDGAIHAGSLIAAFKSKWATLGALAIFLYVGAEVCIGSILINFLVQPEVLGVSHKTATTLILLYWGGAMVGRFVGSAILRVAPAGRVLAAAGGCAAALCLVVSQSTGMFAAVAALAVGLFNSIMFPTIFTLTLLRSSAATSATSGLLCMAIVGGAVLPLMFARVADLNGIAVAFLVPMVAYLAIVVFAVVASKVVVAPRSAAFSATH